MPVVEVRFASMGHAQTGFRDYDEVAMENYLGVFFAQSTDDAIAHFPKRTDPPNVGCCDLQTFREWHGRYVAVGRVPLIDCFVDTHRGGMIKGLSEHTKWLVEMVTLKAILFMVSAANLPKTAGRKFMRGRVVIRD